MEPATDSPPSVEVRQGAESAPDGKKRKKRQHWYVVVVPKGTKVETFETYRQARDFGDSAPKTKEVLTFAGRRAVRTPKTVMVLEMTD